MYYIHVLHTCILPLYIYTYAENTYIPYNI